MTERLILKMSRRSRGKKSSSKSVTACDTDEALLETVKQTMFDMNVTFSVQ